MQVDLDGAGAGLFGVFDGHGGREVALFTARHIKAALMGAESFRKGDYGEALKVCNSSYYSGPIPLPARVPGPQGAARWAHRRDLCRRATCAGVLREAGRDDD